MKTYRTSSIFTAWLFFELSACGSAVAVDHRPLPNGCHYLNGSNPDIEAKCPASIPGQGGAPDNGQELAAACDGSAMPPPECEPHPTAPGYYCCNDRVP